MKRFIAFVLSLYMLLSLTACSGCTHAPQQTSGQKENTITVQSAEEASTKLAELGEDLGYENALSELTEKSTTTVDGDNYYRLQQTYQGIPVYGRTAVCVTDDNGEVIAITGNVQDVDINIDVTPTVTAAEVQEAIKIYLSDELGVSDLNSISDLTLSTDSLYIYDIDADSPTRLVYCLYIDYYEFVVDAHSGAIYTARQMVSDIEGYLASDSKRENGFDIEKYENGYILGDSATGILVKNLNRKSGEKYENIANALLITSKDVIFGNDPGEEDYTQAVHLYNNVKTIANLYKNSCGFKADCIVALFNDSFNLGENALGGRYDIIDGKYYGLISMGRVTGVNDIDVIAHEFGHVMSYKYVGWSGDSVQTGAVNEALSDIFGEIAESWINKSAPDWIMLGDNIDTERNLADPSKSNNASKVGDKSWLLQLLKGDEYYQSTIISHAAYLMWNGIDGDQAKRIDTNSLAKLWYRAMLMMPSDCNFEECRALVELAAQSMRLSEKQLECVREAFDAVGIDDGTVIDYEVNDAATLSVYGANSELYGNYTVKIAGTRRVLKDGVELKENIREMYNLWMIWTYEKYYETRHITTAGAVPFNLEPGTYTITITNNHSNGSSVSFKIRVSTGNELSNVDIYTDFAKRAIAIGDYITLGTYNGEPVVWRCVDIDENGPLMLSDKILCLKAFDASGEDDNYHSDGWGYIRKGRGSNCWSDSNLRQWLNSNDTTIDWTHCSPTEERVYQGYNAYANEAGFLTGFSASELSAIKTVTQKSYINSWETTREGYCDGGTRELNYYVSSTPKDYSNYYYQYVTDRIFLLNPEQADAVYQNLGEYLYDAYPTQSAINNSEYEHTNLSQDKPWQYWLGVPRNEGASYECQTIADGTGEGVLGVGLGGCYNGTIGVRPAFYLDEELFG